MKVIILIVAVVIIFSFVFLIDLQKPKELIECDNKVCNAFNSFLKYQSQAYEYTHNNISLKALQVKEKLLLDAGVGN